MVLSKPHRRHAYVPILRQVALAVQIRQTVGIKTVAVGVIIEARQAEQIINSGKADIALHAANELNTENETIKPIQNGFFVGSWLGESRLCEIIHSLEGIINAHKTWKYAI
jgi:2,4-dienoyl-CoA reductase-like NADH-dependent reductase (Old Yellow Enzyme family)